MKFIFLLALKNLIRYKRRTLLTSLVMAVGILFFIVFAGMLKGFDEKSFENQIQFETGDFKIRSSAFDDDSPLDISNFIMNYKKAEEILKTKSYIESFTERLSFQSELDYNGAATPIIAIAVNPELENMVFSTTNFFTKGNLEDGGAVIGESLAKDMNIQIGDDVYITFRNYQGTIDSVELDITGIINSPDPQVNNSSIYMTLNDAQHYLNTESVTELVLKTKDYKEYRKFQPDLVKSLPGMKVYNWEKLGEDFTSISQAKSKFMDILLFFIAIIAIVGIVNTMLMSVFEKKREIGTLKALGMDEQEITRLFISEGFLIGVLGNIMGLAAGFLINLYFTVYGIDFTALLGSSSINIGYKVMGIVKSGWDIGAIEIAVIMSLLASVVSSYYPAKKAARLQPAECLRTVQ